ncbi:MAG: beta-L-arabinofuranosidase domain-containing protein [Christensenellales bacterium]|jgi:hypothetical protein
MIAKAFFNRAPLIGNRMAALPLGAVKPEGWLKEQLEVQAKGLTGRLYDLWDDVGKNCAWLGGSGYDWENAPYYLDGLLPLAYLLDDEELKEKAHAYIEWMLESQREDGFFGPSTNDDWWPRMIALKAMQQYFTATGDKRALHLMDRFFKYQLKMLDEHPLREWASARGAENMLTALWFYNVTGQKYLLKLLEKLHEQTMDWTGRFHVFPNNRPMEKQYPFAELKELMAKEPPLLGNNRTYYRQEYHFSHVVNVAMGLKTPGVIHAFSSGFKHADGFSVAWDKLMKRHGVAYGMFTGDEHLSGNDPSQGTELCAVVEAMYSVEQLLTTIDDFDRNMPDILEKLAFNALPAQLTKDMMARQYDQQANQISATIAKRNWYNNDDDANIYSFLGNFGCCTANLHQGWPKFVESLWMATNDDGLAAISYAPCSVRFVAGGAPVSLQVDTAYPYETSVRIHVRVKEPTEFPIYLRIPTWAQQPIIRLPDGEIMSVRSGETACVRRKWTGTETILLDLPMQPRKTRWFHQSMAVEMGPLLMCYRPKEDFTCIREGGGTKDYAVETTDAWNWALLDDEAMKGILEPQKASAFKNGEDAAKVLVKAVPIPEWGMKDNSAAPPPIAPAANEKDAQVITLTPYGNSSLRISQFPVAKTHEE